MTLAGRVGPVDEAIGVAALRMSLIGARTGGRGVASSSDIGWVFGYGVSRLSPTHTNEQPEKLTAIAFLRFRRNRELC